MVTVAFDPHFKRNVQTRKFLPYKNFVPQDKVTLYPPEIKDSNLKERVKKQIKKIIKKPETGKPMRYTRKNTREVYVSPFRLSYLYLKKEDRIIFLELYHKDKQ